MNLIALLIACIIVMVIIVLANAEKKWITYFKEHQIILQNTAFSGEKLYIDGQVCDTSKGMFSAELRGHLKSSDGTSHIIVGKIGHRYMGLTIVGSIYVDDKLIGGNC